MNLTVQTLASMAGGRVEGDPDRLITGFAKIEDAKEGDISFIANPLYAHHYQTTNASALLVGENFEGGREDGPALIRVPDPYSTLADLLTAFDRANARPSGIEQPCFISDKAEIGDKVYIGAFAYVGDGAKVGCGSLVYPQVYVGRNVTIGDGCVIYPGVKIYDGCRIGNYCIIHSGAVVGSDGFGFAPKGEEYEKIPQIGIVEIEDNVEIGANTTIDRATFGCTRIGKGTKLDNLIQVAHNVEIGRNNVMAAQTGIAGSTRIGNNNRFGGQCGFAGHIKIGDCNEIGAQSGIPKSIGDHQRLIGYPAIDARKFARNIVYINQLESLFKKQ